MELVISLFTRSGVVFLEQLDLHSVRSASGQRIKIPAQTLKPVALLRLANLW